MAEGEESVVRTEAQLRAEAELSESVARLLGSDLRVAAEDYRLLTRLNEAAAKKYEDMGSVVSGGSGCAALADRCTRRGPCRCM